MFPARPLESLDAHPGAKKILKDSSPSDCFKFLNGVRIVGLMRQCESLSSYALDIFNDVSNEAKVILSRIDKLKRRTEKLESNAESAIQSFKQTTDQIWPFDPVSGKEIPAEPPKQFILQSSNIVNQMIKGTDPVPDLSAFNTAIKDVEKKDEQVNYNKYFSNPDYFYEQYKNEIFEETIKDKQRKKEEQKALRLKEKKEREERKNLKKKNAKEETFHI